MTDFNHSPSSNRNVANSTSASSISTNHGGEPSFQERYPEGRQRLLALAESSKCQSPTPNSQNSTAVNQQQQPTTSAPIGKPKMGIKDLRNRASNQQPQQQQQNSNRLGVNGQSKVEQLSSTMYSSEQSLPDKLSQAIKGGLSAAFRHHQNSNSNLAGKVPSNNSGAVTADDVVYFSPTTTTTASKNRRDKSIDNRRQPNQPLNKATVGQLSKSIEKLDTSIGCEMEFDSSSNAGAMDSKLAVERPKNLMKIQNHSSYGMNLEDLKKMYRSTPDCSTPIDDEEEILSLAGDDVEMNGGANGRFESAEEDSTTTDVSERYGNGGKFEFVVENQGLRKVEKRVGGTVASYRAGNSNMVDKEPRSSNNPTTACGFAQRSNSTTNQYAVDHRHHSSAYDQYEIDPSTAARMLQHARQPSMDSTTTTSPTPERRVRISIPEHQQHQQQSINNHHRSMIDQQQSIRHNNQQQGGVNFRDSCGSPTDSGYRSVPRNEETDQPQSSPSQLLVTSRTPLYTAIPKSIFSISGTHMQQQSIAGQGVEYHLPQSRSESATCNILIMPGGGNGNGSGQGTTASASINTVAPINNDNFQSSTPSKDDSSSGGRRPKTRPPKNGNGITQHARVGSVPPMINHQQQHRRSTAIDDQSISTVHQCHSPYSDLSSPSYGTSASTASSGHSSTNKPMTNGQQQQQSMMIAVVSQHHPNRASANHNPAATTATPGGFDTINTNVSLPEEFSLDRCPKLIELERAPWNEKDVVAVLQRGRTKLLVNQIAIDVVPRVTYLLQRPLVRIAREAQRLCQRFGKCTKFDVQYAMKIILPSLLGDSCHKAALQATAMYTMGGDTLKQSKSQRAGLRGLSVGKFQRWMCDGQLAMCIHDQSAVYLTAVVENLLEEIVLQSMPNNGDMLTAEYLDSALGHNVELWGLLQPYSHLICSRTANGILALPQSASSVSSGSLPSSREASNKSDRRLSLQQQQQQSAKDCKSQHDRSINNCGTLLKNLEQCLLATCVGSTQELGELINRVLNHQFKNGSSPSLAALTSGPNVVGSSQAGKQSPPQWSRDAVKTLFYFMRCSQLEHADNPHSSPPALVLAHERPYLVLPPLIEWLRVSQAHSEHRQACIVDSDDVSQAARILLPGLDYPPRSFGIEDTLPVCGRSSPQTCSQRLKSDLAYRMLTSGNSDRITQAMALLGAQKLDTCNEQGLTPLMWACLQEDETAVRTLLDAGVDANVFVPMIGQQKSGGGGGQSSMVQPELVGWSALTFAVAQRNCVLANLLLERGAVLEAPEMCTETPLQIASMMGHHDLVNLLTTKGADPFHSTVAPEGGFKQRGLPASVSLAASHGHRTVLQAMLTRRRGRSEEVLSLEDFLAEGQQQTAASPSGKGGKSPGSNNQVLLNNQLAMANGNHGGGGAPQNWLGKLNKSQQKTLQEAMYQAAECAHVDITMDLRHLGIPWSTHVWTQTLAAAHELRRKALVQLLLGDFVKYRLDDVNQEFIDDCLPLLFEIFRQSKNEVSTGQLAEIISQLYGEEPIPSIGGSSASQYLDGGEIVQSSMAPRIDAKYVNNPDLSDVQFLIDGGRVFYGHKIVLINASDRFKRLLQQDGSSPSIRVDGVRYDVFQMMMEFLYNGKPSTDYAMDLSILTQLLCAASEYNLRPLKLHCEVLIARCLDIENCIDIYRFALQNDSTELMRYCEGYFLQNLPTLINRSDGYRRLMMCNQPMGGGAYLSTSFIDLSKSTSSGSSPTASYDIIDSLLQTLCERLQQKTAPSYFHRKL